jgi:hypothetical protein
MNLNLVVGFVWLAAGAAYFLWDATADKVPLRGPFGISLGWVLTALAGYNFVRWAVRRRNLPSRDEVHEALEERRREIRERRGPPGPPNPDFLFTDEPPPSSGAPKP